VGDGGHLHAEDLAVEVVVDGPRADHRARLQARLSAESYQCRIGIQSRTFGVQKII
jgi:hypothetical protein